MKQQPRAVCLFSGGLDSTTCLYDALRQGYHVTALTIHYGQTHAREIESARRMTELLKVEHHEVEFRMPWGGSSLTDTRVTLPQNRSTAVMSADIPSTYVPARNMIFLSFALSLAEVKQARALFIGANAIDYSGYPDCRPAFLEGFESAAALGTKAGVSGEDFSIQAPLLKMSKKEIVLFAGSLGVPFELTWSCYAGGKTPCGECDSCVLRAKGFKEAGVRDPLLDS